MSIAPSSPPSPSADELMWLIPDSNDRTWVQATPVPSTTADAAATAMDLINGMGTSPGYWRTRVSRVTITGVPDSTSWRNG